MWKPWLFSVIYRAVFLKELYTLCMALSLRDSPGTLGVPRIIEHYKKYTID